MMIKIAPSILAADFLRLGEQVQEAEASGVDRIQIDVMDGHFVPVISFGAGVVKSIRPITRLKLEAHLMVQPPERFIDDISRAGADTIIVHQEATPHLHRAIEQIHALGKQAGVAINPATPVSMLTEVVALVELVLVMTVNPGFGGQEFIASTLPKIRQVRGMIEERGLHCDLEVDGGINLETAPQAAEAGANVMVAGTSVYGHRTGVAGGVQELLAVCQATQQTKRKPGLI